MGEMLTMQTAPDLGIPESTLPARASIATARSLRASHFPGYASIRPNSSLAYEKEIANVMWRKLGALAIGASAIGALAAGAVAIGSLAVGSLAIGRGRIRRLEIEELIVGRLTVRDGDGGALQGRDTV